MQLQLHTHVSAGGTASIYASSWGAKEASRVIEFLVLYKKWLEQDRYQESYEKYRRTEWYGMTAG